MRLQSDSLGGTEGNARLTSSTGVVLVVLLAIEGITILFLRPLLSLHVFVGMLLVPPVALKLAATGWRFARYYGGSRPYRLVGPPRTYLRLLAPLVVLSTLGVFASGVALALKGPPGGLLLGIHKGSFIVWIGATGIHVLSHVQTLVRKGFEDWTERHPTRSVVARRGAVVASLAVGLVLAAATLHLAGPWHGFAGHDG